MKHLIGKSIERIYQGKDDKSEVFFVCSDGTIYKLDAFETNYDLDILIDSNEITLEELNNWKNHCRWEMFE